jgi:hypothetical protein
MASEYSFNSSLKLRKAFYNILTIGAIIGTVWLIDKKGKNEKTLQESEKNNPSALEVKAGEFSTIKDTTHFAYNGLLPNEGVFKIQAKKYPTTQSAILVDQFIPTNSRNFSINQDNYQIDAVTPEKLIVRYLGKTAK